jgi:hypothetical protein
MADNLTQPDANRQKEVTLQAEDAHICHTLAVPATSQLNPYPLIIWTPRFILIFFLVLTIGLSTASMLTRGWLNAYYPAEWPLIAYTAVNLGGWIAVCICARSPWVRLGGIFGCLWAILMGLTFAMTMFPTNSAALIQTHATVTASTALLGSFFCLSLARTRLQHWDRAFFLLAPIIGSIIVIIYFLITSDSTGPFFLLEKYITTIELWTCSAIWWLRFSCWKTQPGPTFLLGIAPIIQLTLMQPANINTESTVFFSQVMLLSILLGILRILQGQIPHA